MHQQFRFVGHRPISKGSKPRTLPLWPAFDDVLQTYISERALRFPRHRLDRPTTPLFVDTSGKRLHDHQVQYFDRATVRTCRHPSHRSRRSARPRAASHVRYNCARRCNSVGGVTAIRPRITRYDSSLPRGDRRRAPRLGARPSCTSSTESLCADMEAFRKAPPALKRGQSRYGLLDSVRRNPGDEPVNNGVRDSAVGIEGWVEDRDLEAYGTAAGHRRCRTVVSSSQLRPSGRR